VRDEREVDLRARDLVQGYVSPNRSDDGVVRQTVPRLADWLRDTFAAKGLMAPADVDTLVEFVANKGWKMVVSCEVV
jgi:hypothetical protein